MYLANFIGLGFDINNTMKYTKCVILTLYFVELRRSEVTHVEQSLVKNCSHPVTKQES